jgi:hypothetical protein
MNIKSYTLDNDPDFINCVNSDDECIRFLMYKSHNYLSPYTLNKFQSIHNYIEFNTILEPFQDYRKGFIRIELPNNDEKTINDAIKSIVHLHLGCGTSFDRIIFYITLQLNLMLMYQFNLKITTIDTELFLLQHTEEEMNNLICWKENNKIIYNSKYIFANKKTFYLDIPLFSEFYYNADEFIGSKTFSFDYNYSFGKLYKFAIGFEENIIDKSIIPVKQNYIRTNFLSTKYISDYANKCNNYRVNMDIYTPCKFILITMYKTENQLLSIKLNMDVKNVTINYEINSENIIKMDNEDTITYGFSPMIGSNMNLLNMNDHLYLNDSQFYNTNILKYIRFAFEDNVDSVFFIMTYIWISSVHI